MITSYDLVDYIDESIQSVINQEFPCDWELLIGDDGSTDGTIEKLKIWQKKYPDHIRFKINERPKTTEKNGFRAGKNRASLLEWASGDYLIYLDGDDCWLGTEKIKAQFQMLEDPQYTDCSCCAHNTQAYVIPENRKYNITSEDIPTRTFTDKEYWPTLYFHTNTILFRKGCKKLLLNPLYRNHLNDNFITFCILQLGKILYLDKVWAQYNLTGSGLWTGKSRVYGYFRNMTLFDLELHINPSFHLYSYRRHIGDFTYLLKSFKLIDYEIIFPIIKDLDPELYRYTLAMSKLRFPSIEGVLCTYKVSLYFVWNKILLKAKRML